MVKTGINDTRRVPNCNFFLRGYGEMEKDGSKEMEMEERMMEWEEEGKDVTYKSGGVECQSAVSDVLVNGRGNGAVPQLTQNVVISP